MQNIGAQYNLFLVALSYVIAVLGSLTALRIARRIPAPGHPGRLSWTALAGFAMGGGAIWSMHFIGMLAFRTKMLVSYDLGLTLASLVLAVAVTALGFWLLSGPKGSWGRLIATGTLVGLGVAGMHYTGMAAMRMRATHVYDTLLVAVSILIAIVAATVALWLAFNLSRAWQMLGAALVMGLAVCGMHYTGMAAVSMVPNPEAAGPGLTGFTPELLAYVVFLVSLVILVAGLLVTASENRMRFSPDPRG